MKFLAWVVLASCSQSAIAGDMPTGSSTDLWNFDQGGAVTGSSALDAGLGDFPYDPRDVFGGEFTTYPVEVGGVVFTDGLPAGTTHWLEWQTLQPTNLTEVHGYLWGDADGVDHRHTSIFKLYARTGPSAIWELVLELTQLEQPPATHRWEFAEVLDNPALNVAQFRAEIVQMSPSELVGGPRVVELDGFGQIVPGAGALPLYILAATSFARRRYR